MAGTNNLLVYENDFSNDKYKYLKKNNPVFSEIEKDFSNCASFFNDRNEPLNFENLYPDSKSKLNAMCDDGRGIRGVLTATESVVKKLEEEAALAVQHGGTKKAVIKERYIADLLERKEDQLSFKLVGEEDITKLFSEITARLYHEKKAYSFDKSKETKSCIVTGEDVMDLYEHIKAFNPSEDYGLDLTKQIINDGDLWMSNGRSAVTTSLVRELIRRVPEDQLEEIIKKPLRGYIQKALSEEKLKEASNYLGLLFGATPRTSEHKSLNKILLSSVDKLSKKPYEPLLIAVASFLAGAPRARFTEVRNKFKKLDLAQTLRGEQWIIREALR